MPIMRRNMLVENPRETQSEAEVIDPFSTYFSNEVVFLALPGGTSSNTRCAGAFKPLGFPTCPYKCSPATVPIEGFRSVWKRPLLVQEATALDWKLV